MIADGPANDLPGLPELREDLRRSRRRLHCAERRRDSAQTDWWHEAWDMAVWSGKTNYKADYRRVVAYRYSCWKYGAPNRLHYNDLFAVVYGKAGRRLAATAHNLFAAWKR